MPVPASIQFATGRLSITSAFPVATKSYSDPRLSAAINRTMVRLSGRTWTKQTAIAAEAPIFTYFDLEEQPAAIVGPGLLIDNSLAIDFAGQRLFIGPTVTKDQ
jgi:hypothetical protein